ncbi:MAG: CBS domain-containing protein [Nitrososphaera sp.]|jgi:CBS domain-containing protein
MSAVSEIMSAGVVTIDGDASPSVLDVVDLMVKKKVGSVIIMLSGKPAGIITERDVMKKVSARNKKAQDISAKSIMSAPLVTVKAYDSLDTAASIMSKKKIKRLPVVEKDGTLAGILSVSDIAKRLAKILSDDYNRYRSLKRMLEL